MGRRAGQVQIQFRVAGLLLAVVLAGLLATGCGRNPKPVVAPPVASAMPAMPPGVSWGPPTAADTQEAGPLAETEGRPASVASSDARFAMPAGKLPPPPRAHPDMPLGNYDLTPRVGQIWETGVASFYGPREQGKDTASGQPFDFHKMTAAHRLLPLGTRVKVTDLKTTKSVVVTINDRGPFWPTRILDLSWGAAQKIGDEGLDPVRIQIVSLPSPMPVGQYTVMVGWFTDSGPLKQCYDWMQQRLDKPVITLHSDEGRWLRYGKSVRLDAETASAVARELRQQNYQAYLVRLN